VVELLLVLNLGKVLGLLDKHILQILTARALVPRAHTHWVRLDLVDLIN
jgi:hypothetical protein